MQLATDTVYQLTFLFCEAYYSAIDNYNNYIIEVTYIQFRFSDCNTSGRVLIAQWETLLEVHGIGVNSCPPTLADIILSKICVRITMFAVTCLALWACKCEFSN